MKTSLVTEESQTAYSCDQGEQLLANGDYDNSRVYSEINKITDGFKNLTPISLKENKISIDVAFVKNETYSPESNEIMRAIFDVSVYEDDIKIKNMSVQGCNAEQTFTFEGYAIPGFNKKIVLLLSTKGDCFEGGYIKETLYVVGGLDSVSRNTAITSFKNETALSPHEGTLVVFESDEVIGIDEEEATTTSPSTTTNSFRLVTLILAAIAAILLGTFFGRLSKRKQ